MTGGYFLARPFRGRDMPDGATMALDRDKKRRQDEKDISDPPLRFVSLVRPERLVTSLAAPMSDQAAAAAGVNEIRVNTSWKHRKMAEDR